MPFVYEIKVNRQSEISLDDGEFTSLTYHNIFDYPLSFSELIKWRGTTKTKIGNSESRQIKYKNGFYFFENRDGIVFKRLLRKRISARKLRLANKAGSILSLIPTIRLVAVTGALAMENVSDESDIDLMLISKKGTLWTTRFLSTFLLRVLKVPTRKFGDKTQKDKICLNMWLDEGDLVWKKPRNIYTAHEIAQVIPLVNKESTYEKFILKNRWIAEYWPKAVKILGGKDIRILRARGSKKPPISQYLNIPVSLLEKFAFQLQYKYMKPKITREVVTPTRAFFHPVNWGELVLSRLISTS